METPSWADSVAEEIAFKYPPQSYVLDRIEAGGSPGEFTVHVRGRWSDRRAAFRFDGWASEVESIGSGRPSFDAFVDLLHIHLDEQWSGSGGGS
jgi:hypothetical protein